MAVFLWSQLQVIIIFPRPHSQSDRIFSAGPSICDNK
uniref:K Homology domain-containing protein n=1 Tax=Parascaris univalens TaxID=6257 RepID=A0A914ZYT6_PARUN